MPRLVKGAERRGRKVASRKKRGSKPQPKPSRKHGKQLNALVKPELFGAFADHCLARNQKRDRTVEVALQRYLRAEDPTQDKEFYVTLDEDSARRLNAFRRLRQMPERSLLVEEALRGHIAAVLGADVVARAQYEAILADIHGSEPN